MSHPAKRQFARVVAARQRLLDLRAQRMDQLQRLRNFAKTQLNDFVSTVDPVTALRYCEVQADGNRQRGDLAVSIVFYEGTKVTIGLDSFGKFSYASTHEGMLAGIGELTDLHVTADTTRAQLTFETEKLERRYIDFGDVLDELIEVVVRAVESDVPDAAAVPAAVSLLRPSEPALPSVPLAPASLTFSVR